MTSQNDDDKQAPAGQRGVHIMDIADSPSGESLRKIFGRKFDLADIYGPIESLVHSIAMAGSSPQDAPENLLRLLLLIQHAPEPEQSVILELAIKHALFQTEWLYAFTGDTLFRGKPDEISLPPIE